MNYPLAITKDKPAGLWLLDDTAPFQDYSGNGLVGEMSTGTPGKASSLAESAVYSSVFNRSNIARFASPVFKQGYESKPFSLESWVYPISKTEGYTAQTYRENLHGNPSAETALSWYAIANGATMTRQTASAINWGSYGIRVSAPANGIADAGINMFGGMFDAVQGETYTISVYVRAITAGTYNLSVQGAGSQSPDTRTSITLAANTVGRLTRTWTASTSGKPAAYVLRSSANANVVTDWDIDAVMVEKGSTATTYFDGSMPGFEWVGTANGSISRTRADISNLNLSKNPDASNANYWTNIASTTHTRALDTSFGHNKNNSVKYTLTAAGNLGGKNHIVPSEVEVLAGDTVRWSIWVYATRTNNWTPYWERLGGTYKGGTAGSAITVPANTWTKITGQYTFTADNAVQIGTTVYFGFGAYAATGWQTGDVFWLDEAIIVKNQPLPEYFDGDTPGAVWTGPATSSMAAMLTSQSEQKILSNNSQYDGLTIDGTKVHFSTKYLNSGSATCEYDLQFNRKAHVVGVHTAEKNMLYVNGILVDEVDISDAQQADQFVATDGYLYSGKTDSSTEIAVNGQAVYALALTAEQIINHYKAGNSVLEDSAVTNIYGGSPMAMNVTSGDMFTEIVWDATSFKAGSFINTVEDAGRIKPILFNSVSQPSSWTNIFAMASTTSTSIYGVSIDWTGIGVSIDVSLDGTSWTPVEKRTLVSIVPNGFDPTDKELIVRASFAGGIVDDESYLERISVIGWVTGNVPLYTNRPVTISYPAVLRGDSNVFEYRDDAGVYLNGGSLTIGTDASPDPLEPSTIELWVRVNSGTMTINQTGTSYINSVAGTNLDIGEWTLYHLVTAAPVVGDIVISGDVSIAHLGLYEDAKTSTEIADIYALFTGKKTLHVAESSALSITGSTEPVKIYANDWAITGAG